ncbi:MAG TPA: hypothetical protein VHB74_10320 [Devosia sp.]|nr:hypothetical protein [Devosia sp.]
MKTSYRGFDIQLTQSDRWTAEIVNASTGRAWSQRPSTPLEEGANACLRLARNLVDAFLALRGAQ